MLLSAQFAKDAPNVTLGQLQHWLSSQPSHLHEAAAIAEAIRDRGADAVVTPELMRDCEWLFWFHSNLERPEPPMSRDTPADRWVFAQRDAYREDRLTEWQNRKLMWLPWWFDFLKTL